VYVSVLSEQLFNQPEKESAMLEHASPDTIAQLLIKSGQEVTSLNFRKLPEGTLVRIRTESQNIYLAEVTGPVDRYLKVNSQFFFGPSRTSPVTNIVILAP